MFLPTLLLLTLLLVFPSSPLANATIRDDETWLDTDGNRINAHGGGMLYDDGVWYWYGECKGDSTWRTPGVDWECYRTEAGGVNCYSSTDLIHWHHRGLVLTPDTTADSPISTYGVIERPKVIRCADTGRYVMWIHIDNDDYSKACAGVAVSDSPTGPFRFLHDCRPMGEESRDMTLFQDIDGRCYLICSTRGNSTLRIYLLTPDATDFTGTYVEALPGQSREAPAIMRHDGRYWMLTSGCSGWDPNEAQVAVADSMLGHWSAIGNPCQGPDANNTFHAQSTYIIPPHGNRPAIAMFDRWNKTQLDHSTYLWLPITFRGGAMVIRKDEKRKTK